MSGCIAADSKPVWASIAFVVVLIGFGVPIWWYTTNVHRAPLPYEEIDGLPLFVPKAKVVVNFKCQEGVLCGVVESIEALLGSGTGLDVEVVKLEFSQEELKVIEQSDSVEMIDMLLHEVSSVSEQSENLVLFELPDKISLGESNIVLGRYNFIYITKETTVAHVTAMFQKVLYPAETSLQQASSPANENKLPSAISYNILITLAMSNPNADWNVESIVDYYITAFVDKFASVANLSVSSQVVYVGDGMIDASSKGSGFELNEDQVASLINALETKLGSQISVEPTFHWVMYVPHVNQSPMKIRLRSDSAATNSVLSPRWNGGGLQIVSDELDEAMCAGLILAQLRKALGLQNDVIDFGQVSSLSYDASGIHQWQLHDLTRRRTVNFLHNAATTLKSLCQLLSQIENIVISDTVGDDVAASLRNVLESRQALSEGLTGRAYRAAQMAVTYSERTFFHPSLLALLYFPNDQKYAIYIPLFLPVGIPVLLSLQPIIKYFMKRNVN